MFLLAPLFFLLPFATVSVEVRELGMVELSYTGLDLVTGGAPGAIGTGQFSSVPDQATSPVQTVPPGTRILAVLAALLILGGLVATLRPATEDRARGRRGVIGLSAAAAGLLMITELVVSAKLHSTVSDLRLSVPTPGGTSFPVTASTRTGLGFWLSLLTLVFGFAVGSGLRRNAISHSEGSR